MHAMKKTGFFCLAIALLFGGPVYGEKGDLTAIHNTLGDFFGIYLLRPEKRSPWDVVTAQELPGGGYSAEISYWRPPKNRNPAEEICNAYRWLLLGRGTKGKGVAEAFEKFPLLTGNFPEFRGRARGNQTRKEKGRNSPDAKSRFLSSHRSFQTFHFGQETELDFGEKRSGSRKMSRCRKDVPGRRLDRSQLFTSDALTHAPIFNASLFVWIGITLAQGPTPTPDEHLAYWIRTLQTHPMNLVRKNAARSLGTLSDRSATPALIGALKDRFFGVRAEAARSLGLLTDSRATDALTETANNDTDAQVRRNAREAIEKIKAYEEFLKKKQEKLENAANKPKA